MFPHRGDEEPRHLSPRARQHSTSRASRRRTHIPPTRAPTQTLTTTTIGGSSGLIQQLSYAYDLVGNLTTISNALPVPTPVPPNTVVAPGPTSQSFTYDDLYQLTGASGTYSGCACGCGNSRLYTLTMQYDGLGNIQRKNQTDTIIQPSGASTPQVATTYNNPYTYSTAATRLPHAPISIGNEALTYDPDGNMKGTTGMFGPARVFNWTEDDRLRTETDSGFTNTYLYDAAGNRTTKRRTSIETWYVNPFYVLKGYSTETKHIMLGDERVASEMATVPTYTKPSTAGAGTVFYDESNNVQSTQFTTGSDGSILQHDEYFPTGETWISESKNNDPRNVQPWMFNAKELDETGLYAFGARYYNPKYSVWSSPDPLLASYMQGQVGGGAFEPLNLGLYSYAWNNPVALHDPDGTTTAVPQGPPPPTRIMPPPGYNPPSPSPPPPPPAAGAGAGEAAAEGLEAAGEVAAEANPIGLGFMALFMSDTAQRPLSAPGANSGSVQAPPMSRGDTRPAEPGPNEPMSLPPGGMSCCYDAPSTPGPGGMLAAQRGPDPAAGGAHTTFRRDPKTGKVSHYETFEPQSNPQNPAPWESNKRFDRDGDSHFNKKTRQDVPTPHVHDPAVPGGVRPAEPHDTPK